jgi:hypothetical protein
MSEEASAPIEAQAPVDESTEQVIEETEEEIAASPEDQEKQVEAEKKAEENLRRKYNLKVNNKVKEVELDLSNDEEVQKYLQKALAAEEKFQEAASVRKQAEQLVNALKTNPLAVLMHPELGLDVKALAQQVLTQEIEDMQKTPEQKRIEELERALKDREEKERSLEEEKRQAEMSRIQEEAFQELDSQISSALSKSELPKSPYVVKRIADAMIEAVNMGYKDITVEQIMPFVEDSITTEFQRMFDEAPEQTAEKLMEKLVGKKNLDRYRKTKVARVKRPVQASVQDTGGKTSDAEKKEENLKFKDVFSPW